MPDLDKLYEKTGESGWLLIEFTGFDPKDDQSTLFRKWQGQIKAIRSDGEAFFVNVIHLQKDTPLKMGEDLVKAFTLLESFRGCKCTGRQICQEHKEVVENHQGGPTTE